MADYLTNDSLTQRPANGRLYFSDVRGKTWQLLFEKENFGFSEIVFSNSLDNTIYAACIDSGVFVSNNGGRNFQKIMNGLPTGYRYNTIAIASTDSDLLYTAPRLVDEPTKVRNVPIYYSEDNGQSWKIMKEYAETDFINYPSYIKNSKYVGWAIARMLVDIEDPQILYMSNWFGVSVSRDGGQSWNGNFYKGTETVCLENVVLDPNVPGKAYITMPDHSPYFTTDGGKTFTQYKLTPGYHNSTALVSSLHQKGLVIFGVKKDWSGYKGSAIMRSEDDGKNFEIVQTFENGLTLQAIQEDIHNSGNFYAYIYRSIENGAGLYHSKDYGKTWERINLQLPEYINNLPYHEDWIENELLSVVYGQKKNVCGTNQLLCMDRTRPGTIFDTSFIILCPFITEYFIFLSSASSSLTVYFLKSMDSI